VGIDMSPKRRGVIVSLGLVVGVAGCTGGESSGESTTLPEEVEETMTKEEMTEEQQGQRDSIIPGEVVHDGLSGIEILDHWAEQDQRDWVKFRVMNNRDEPFDQPTGASPDPGDDILRARTLTGQGNVLASAAWTSNTSFGPTEIDPNTSATVGLSVDPAAENAARYEICFHKRTDTLSIRDWAEVCSSQ
jgi:hypothetical protein